MHFTYHFIESAISVTGSDAYIVHREAGAAMKFEEFQAGRWQLRYQCKSFEPEKANQSLGELNLSGGGKLFYLHLGLTQNAF